MDPRAGVRGGFEGVARGTAHLQTGVVRVQGTESLSNSRGSLEGTFDALRFASVSFSSFPPPSPLFRIVDYYTITSNLFEIVIRESDREAIYIYIYAYIEKRRNLKRNLEKTIRSSHPSRIRMEIFQISDFSDKVKVKIEDERAIIRGLIIRIFRANCKLAIYDFGTVNREN